MSLGKRLQSEGSETTENLADAVKAREQQLGKEYLIQE